MATEKTDPPEAPAPARKGKKLLLFVGVPLLLLGGGGGAGVYAMQAGWLNAAASAAAETNEPRLVPKGEETRASLAGDSGAKGEGDTGKTTPAGEGGDKYASSYYPMEKEFTSNLRDSVHFVQIGVAVSTPYDQRVLENLKTHEIAVRSAILMSLGETTEDEVFTSDGKKLIQRRLAKAINDVLKEKEGFGGVGNVYFTNFIVQ